MKTLAEMTEVRRCEAQGCAYNVGNRCHARAITIGDLDRSLCDTMMMAGRHTRRREIAGVGACRSVNCLHNEDYGCQAEGVEIRQAGYQAHCASFQDG